MSRGGAPSAELLRQTRSLFGLGPVAGLTDAQLLDRFVDRDSETREVAFAALVTRHGPMVLGVCRRLLDDAHSAEDAFQATFLVLARKAGSVRVDDSLGRWLYGVARRVAGRSRTRARRRLASEVLGLDPSTRPAKPEGPGTDDALGLIDEELGRLPEPFRTPIVLCCLEELSYEEAARQLAWPLGTVKSRLSRAKEMLRSRLARRGVMVSAAFFAHELCASSRAAVPTALAGSTAEAAAGLAGNPAIAASLLAELGRGVLSNPRRALASALAATCLVATGASVARQVARPPAAAIPDDPPIVAEARETARPDEVRAATTPEPAGLAVAHAPPMEGIAIDGDLADWPPGLRPIPIRTVNAYPNYSKNGLDRVDPDDNPNLVASFLSGYDAKAGVIYLAVVVRDDRHVVAFDDPWHTDAVEIFVDGTGTARKLPLGSSWWSDQYANATVMPALQYVGIAGEGSPYGTGGGNAALMYGDIRKTRSRMAYRRSGDRTIYEWAIQPFDRYPNTPTQLAPGRRIGLDVVVVDRDVKSTPSAWVSWAPGIESFKGFDSSGLGTLILDGPR